MSKGQLQGHVIENLLVTKYNYLRTCVITHFHVILTCKTFHGLIFVIQVDLQGQKVILKVKFLKYYFQQKYKYHSCGYEVN